MGGQVVFAVYLLIHGAAERLGPFASEILLSLNRVESNHSATRPVAAVISDAEMCVRETRENQSIMVRAFDVDRPLFGRIAGIEASRLDR